MPAEGQSTQPLGKSCLFRFCCTEGKTSEHLIKLLMLPLPASGNVKAVAYLFNFLTAQLALGDGAADIADCLGLGGLATAAIAVERRQLPSLNCGPSTGVTSSAAFTIANRKQPEAAPPTRDVALPLARPEAALLTRSVALPLVRRASSRRSILESDFDFCFDPPSPLRSPSLPKPSGRQPLALCTGNIPGSSGNVGGPDAAAGAPAPDSPPSRVLTAGEWIELLEGPDTMEEDPVHRSLSAALAILTLDE